MSKIKVLLVDDHYIVRDGIKARLETEDDFEVVASVENGKLALEVLENSAVDIVFLDLEMPVMDGFSLLKILRERKENVKVIVLSMFDSKDTITKCINMGIEGFISKHLSTADLIDASRKVMSGLTYICHETIELLKMDAEQSALCKSLSPQELVIVKLIAQGKNSHEMSELLGLSEHTVKSHREHINEKLDLHSPAQIALFAIENNLIIPSHNLSIRNQLKD